MAEKGGSSVWLWVGLGCGALVLVFGCFGGIGAYFYFQAKNRSEQAFAEYERMEAQRRAEEEAQRMAMMEAERQAMNGQQPGGPTLPGNPLPSNPALPTAPRPTNTSPITITAQVTAITGNPGVSPGTQCVFVVEQHDQSDRPAGYWCRANVMCGLTLLYGGGTSGYFPCTVFDSPRAVVGIDGDTTSSDTDGSLELDTRAGRLRVTDDASGRLGAFSVDAQVTSAI
jgi:hypothetical protein